MSKDSKSQRATQGEDRPDAKQEIKEQHEDIEFPSLAEMPALLPEGVYEMAFVRAEKYEFKSWKRWKIFLWFQVVTSGNELGQKLYMGCTAPGKGRVALGSKYWLAWTVAAGRRPERRDRLSTKIFRGKVFLGRVRTVKKKTDKDGYHTARLPEQYYSTIDELIERCTGGDEF